MRIRLNFMWALVPLLAVIMRLASVTTAEASYFLVAGYALAGRAQAIQALALSWLFSMLSPALAPEAVTESVGRYVILGAATLSILLRSFRSRHRKSISKMVLGTAALGVFLVAHSFIVSPIVDVSVLKAVSWTVATCTLLSAWSGLSEEERLVVANRLYFGFSAILVASVPLLVLPIGYLRNGSAFQGVFNQPQSFGLAMAILGAWATAKMLGARRPSWGHAGIVVVAAGMIMMSGARTAGLALVIGVAIASVGAAVSQRRKIFAALPGLRSSRLHFVVFLGLVATVLAGSMLMDRLESYLVKDDGSETLVDVYALSRGGQVREMWANVEDNWLTGIGFGIGSNLAEMIVVRDPILDLPVSASIEKGVLPVAILEELGVFGFVLVCLWIWAIVRRSGRSAIAPFAVLLTILLLNLGENTLFSPGGFGLISLVLIAWAATAGKYEQQHA